MAIEIEAEIIGSVDKKSFDEAVTYARDTWKKIEPLTLLEYKTNVAKLKIDLDTIRAKLRDAKKEDNKELILKYTIQTQEAQSNLTEMKRKLTNLKNTWDASLSRLQQKFNWLWSGIKSSLASMISFTSILYWIKSAYNALLDVTVSYESAFAWFRKTLNATEPQLKAIEKGIVNMSRWMPKSVEELSKITELWGQMWIASQDILEFTRVTAELSTAIDWISAEDAATTLARLQAQTWWSISTLENLWSALVALWNNFKANEWEILWFANELKAAWWIVWLSAQDVLWISTAYVDAWINAEAGWTAVTKALLKIDDNVNQSWVLLWEFAKISWKTKSQFTKDWKWDTANTFADILQWISDSWDKANTTIETLFGSDIRLKKAMLAVANAGWTLKEAIKSANIWFKDANALAQEYGKRLKTVESQQQINQNRWKSWANWIWQWIWKASLAFNNFFLKVIPQWFAVFQFWIRFLVTRANQSINALEWLFFALRWAIAFIFTWIADIMLWLWKNIWVFAFNFIHAFDDLPSTLTTALNFWIKKVEDWINFIWKWVKKLWSLLWFDTSWLWDIVLPKLDDSWVKTQFKEFQKFTFDISKKNRDLTEQTVLDKARENQILEDSLSKFALTKEKEASLATKSYNKQKFINDSLAKQSKLKDKLNQKEIVTINSLEKKLANYKAELKNAEIWWELYNSLQKKITATEKELNNTKTTSNTTTKKSTEEKTKEKEATQKLKEEKDLLRKTNIASDDSYKLLNKSIASSTTKIEDYRKEIKKVTDEINSYQDKINELDKTKWETLWKRSVDIDKQRLDILKKIANLQDSWIFWNDSTRIQDINTQLQWVQTDANRNKLLKTRDTLLNNIWIKLKNDNSLSWEAYDLKKKLIDLDKEQSTITWVWWLTDKQKTEATRVSELSITDKYLEEYNAKKATLIKEKTDRETRLTELENERQVEEWIVAKLTEKKTKLEDVFTKFYLKTTLSRIKATDKFTISLQNQINKLRERNTLLWISSKSTSDNAITNNTTNTTSWDTIVHTTINNPTNTEEVKNIVIDAVTDAQNWINN